MADPRSQADLAFVAALVFELDVAVSAFGRRLRRQKRYTNGEKSTQQRTNKQTNQERDQSAEGRCI